MPQACTFGSVKIILVCFTTLIVLLGAALLGISIFMYVESDSVYLSEEKVSGFDTGVVIFIGMGAGASMIIFSLIGMAGALSKSKGVLIFFFTLLLLTFFLEIAGGITGFVWRDNVQDDLPKEMGEKLLQYNDDSDVTKAWDEIHDKYECCGRMGPSDFVALTGGPAPTSCKTYKSGCYYDVEKNLKRTLEMGSAALICLALFQLLVMCFTGLMLIKLYRGEGKRKM